MKTKNKQKNSMDSSLESLGRITMYIATVLFLISAILSIGGLLYMLGCAIVSVCM